jgi:hypothetical protein
MSWYIILPTYLENLITNPSFELNTNTGWSGITNSVIVTSVQNYKGIYSGSYTPASGVNDGMYYGFTSPSSEVYGGQAYFLGVLNVPYKIWFGTTGGALVGSATTFTGTGEWQKVFVSATLSSGTSYRLYITKNSSSSTTIYYVDGAMVYVSDTEMTYIDGDEDDCYWTGTAHASVTRSEGYSRKIGILRNLTTFETYNLGQSATGMPPIQNNSTPYSTTDGALYQGRTIKERPFTLTFQINPDPSYTDSVIGWHANRSQIIRLFRPNEVVGDQPVRLIYTDNNKEMYIDAIYDGGLELQDGIKDIEVVSIRLIAYDPYFYSTRVMGFPLSPQLSVSNANYILQKTKYNYWTAMGSGASGGAVYAIAEGPDKTIYAGGAFTSMNSVSNTSRIAKWNPYTGVWTAMGTGASGGNVQAIVANSNGNVVAAGTFTSMGGVANTNGLALWNGSAWSSIGTLAGGSSDGYALIYDRLGNLVLTGDFTSVGGVAAVNIAKRDTSGTWTAFGSGIGSSGLALAVSGNNTIYVAGSFLTANGGVTTVNSITYWNGTTWAAMGPAASPGLTGAANTAGWHLIFAPDGRLIVSGPFRTAGGVSCNHVAYWNGVSFIPFGSGVGYNGTAALADSTGIVDSFFLSNGTWFAGGQFGNPTSSFANPMAGGMVFPDSLALWTGSAWTYVDIDPPGNSKVSAVLQSSTETTYIGFDTSGTALAANFVSTYGGSLLSDTEEDEGKRNGAHAQRRVSRNKNLVRGAGLSAAEKRGRSGIAGKSAPHPHTCGCHAGASIP